jgi:hypothetical protein
MKFKIKQSFLCFLLTILIVYVNGLFSQESFINE